MHKANFVYKKNQFVIFCQSKNSLKELFDKFINKAKIQNKEIVFLYNGNKIIDENKSIEQLTNDISFTILVNDADKLNKDINSFKYN